MLLNDYLEEEVAAALKERFAEIREEQKKDRRKVDWFSEYAKAAVPTIRRLLVEKELQNTAFEISQYDDQLMYSVFMKKEMLNFILDNRKVLMDRMAMLNDELKRWKR